jgi:glycosyltransferase involved in cell wall biosynthesis
VMKKAAFKRVIVLGVDPRSLINFRRALICELVAQGHEVIAVAHGPSKLQIISLEILGAKVMSVDFARAGMNPFKDIGTFFELVRLFKVTKPDAVFAYTSKPVIYGALAASFAKVPRFNAMITGLGYSFVDGPEFKRRIARFSASFLYKRALAKCSAVIFQNPDDRATFEKLRFLQGVPKVGVVNGSGVDLDYFRKCVLPDAPVFLMIARLLADKGIHEYVAASVALRKRMPSARTLLIGGLDPSPNSVTQSQLDVWIKDGIEYLGKAEDVRPIIAQASVIVLPSYREGTPRSVLEGMAMGRAIITTDVPGCRETVQNGINGFLVPARDSAALLNAMVALAGDAKTRTKMATASYKIVVEKYEATSVAKSTIQLADI